MEFKGTQGKWSIMSAKQMSVPFIIHIGGETIFQCYNTYGNDDAKYNTLLISKAPEMLEMLIKCEKVISDLEIATDDIKELIKQATEI